MSSSLLSKIFQKSFLIALKSKAPYFMAFRNIKNVRFVNPSQYTKVSCSAVLRILALWIRIRKNMRIHGSGSKGQNINQKLQKKLFTPKTQI